MFYQYRYPQLTDLPLFLKPPFDALPKQLDFMASEAAENLYSGAVRAGKSRALMEKLYQIATVYPGIRIGVFRKVRSTIMETTLRTLLVDVLGWPSVEDDQGGIIKAWRKSELKLVFHNSSEVIFFGMDKLTKIGSLELGAAFLDEVHEFDESDWNMIQTRLSQPVMDKQQMFAACNPASPSHWLYEKFFKTDDPELFVISTNSYENPFLGDEYIARLNRMSGLMKRRLVDGEWIGFAGIIYDCYDQEKHIVEEVPADQSHYINFRSIDFGGHNPHVCQWWRYDPISKHLYLYREVYYSGISIEDFCRMILENQPDGENIRYSVSDHDASERMYLAKHGIPTIAAIKDVRRGLQDTYEKIANHEIFFYREALVETDWKLKDDSGAIRRKRPQSTLEELTAYEWAISADNAKDQPVKKDDHGMDAMRYAVESIIYQQRPSAWTRIQGV